MVPRDVPPGQPPAAPLASQKPDLTAPPCIVESLLGAATWSQASGGAPSLCGHCGLSERLQSRGISLACHLNPLDGQPLIWARGLRWCPGPPHNTGGQYRLTPLRRSHISCPFHGMLCCYRGISRRLNRRTAEPQQLFLRVESGINNYTYTPVRMTTFHDIGEKKFTIAFSAMQKGTAANG